MSDSFRKIEGEQLGAVTFVQDYLQLHFDGPYINVYVPMGVSVGGVTTQSGSVQFRNALCGQIAKRVRKVSFQEAESLNLSFDDGSQIAISLRAEDYSGPEALSAHGFGEVEIVV